MAKVGAQRAAELTGKSKSTIQRAMNSGKLSYEIDVNDRRIIDVSELERVFGLAPASSHSNNAPAASVEAELKKATDMIEMERMKMKIKMLEDQLEQREHSFEDMKAQRDQWQKQAQQVLITSQYSQKQAEEYKAELKSREEQARKRREQMMAERMQKGQGQGQTQKQGQNQGQNAQNQNKPGSPAEQRRLTETNAQTAQEPETAGMNFQTLWKKIKGDKAA